MKSLQMFLAVLFLSVFIGNSSADEDINLLQIVFIEDSSVKIGVVADASVEISFACVDEMIPGIKDHNLVFTQVGGTAIEHILHSKTEATVCKNEMQSITFKMLKADFVKIEGNELTCNLYTTISDDITFTGKAIINIDACIVSPLTLKPTVIRDIANSGKCDLRIAENVPADFYVLGGDLDIAAATTCIAGGDKPCYFMDVGGVIGADIKFSVCKAASNEDNPLLLCSISKEFTENNIPGYANSEITITTNLIQISDESGNGRYEMILSHGKPIETVVCEGAFKNRKTSECAPTIPDDYDILLVGVSGDNGDVVDFLKTSVKDIGLSAKTLSPNSNIIEVSVINVGEKLFQMTNVKGADRTDDPYTVAQVDCREIFDDSDCKGYFVDVDNGKYQISVNLASNKDTVDKKLTYISQEVTVNKPAKLEITKEIEVQNIQVKQDNQENYARFCFENNEKVLNKTNYYEIILITKMGYQKRTTLNNDNHDTEDCSSAINLSKEQCGDELSLNMLILEREIHTGKVLATGEKLLQISALRDIKPEVDNGSDGSTSTLAIVGAAIAGIACLMALVAAAIMFVMKMNRDNDGLQYPLHRNNIEDSSIIHGLENPIPNM